MNQFILGAIALGMAMAGLFFLRFWRETRDPLFFLFGLAFFLQALGRAWMAYNHTTHDRGDYLYWMRLVSYLLILMAIVYKNRGQKT